MSAHNLKVGIYALVQNHFPTKHFSSFLGLTSQIAQHRCSATAAPTMTTTPSTTTPSTTTPYQRKKARTASHVTNQSVTSFTGVTPQTWGSGDECNRSTTLFRVSSVTFRHCLTRKSWAKLIRFDSPLGKSQVTSHIYHYGLTAPSL